MEASCRKHEAKCNKKPGRNNLCWKCSSLVETVERVESKDGYTEKKTYSCSAYNYPLHPTVNYVVAEDSVRMPTLTCPYYSFNSTVGML